MSPQWTDVTEKFKEAQKSMKPGELIHSSKFNLQSAVHALELGAKKMDANYVNVSVDSLLKEAGVFETTSITTNHAVEVIDLAMSAFYVWLDQGAFVSQSICAVTWCNRLDVLAASTNKVAQVMHHSLYAVLCLVHCLHDVIRISGVGVTNEDYGPLTTSHDVIWSTSVQVALQQISLALEIASSNGMSDLLPRVECLNALLQFCDTLLMITANAVVNDFEFTPYGSIPAAEVMKNYQSRNPSAALTLKDLVTESNARVTIACNLLTSLSKDVSGDAAGFSHLLFNPASFAESQIYGPPKYVAPLCASKSHAALAKIFTSLRVAMTETLSSATSISSLYNAIRRRLRTRPSLIVRSGVSLTINVLCDVEGTNKDEQRRVNNLKKYKDALTKLATLKAKKSPAAPVAPAGKKDSKKRPANDDNFESLTQLNKAEKAVDDAIREFSLDVLPASAPRSFTRLVLDELVRNGMREDLRAAWMNLPAMLRAMDASETAIKAADDLASTHANLPLAEFAAALIPKSTENESEEVMKALDFMSTFEQIVSELSILLSRAVRTQSFSPHKAHRDILHGKVKSAFLMEARSVLQLCSQTDRLMASTLKHGGVNPATGGMLNVKPCFAIMIRDFVAENVLFQLISGFEMELYELQDMHMMSWAICELIEHLLSSKRVILTPVGNPPKLPDTPESLAYTGLFFYFKALMSLSEFLLPLTFNQMVHEEQSHARFNLRFNGLLFRWPIVQFEKYVKCVKSGLENHDLSLKSSLQMIEKLQMFVKEKELTDNVKVFELMATKCAALGQSGTGGDSISKSVNLLKLTVMKLSKMISDFESTDCEEEFFKFKGLKLSNFKITLKGHPMIPTIEF